MRRQMLNLPIQSGPLTPDLAVLTVREASVVLCQPELDDQVNHCQVTFSVTVSIKHWPVANA